MHVYLRNRYIHVHVLHCEECKNHTVYFCISDDVSNFQVTMVAEFCSLVILIHNTLLGDITISST